jgi:hypothetical protein
LLAEHCLKGKAMDYVGKTVRLKNEFLENSIVSDESRHLKCGTVIDQQAVGLNRHVLVVDDTIFGTWVAVDSNVEVLSSE